jgi:hypothetical protein
VTRLAATAVIAGIVITGCASSGMSITAYGEAMGSESASYAGEIDGLRDGYAFEMQDAIAALQRDMEGEALRSAAVAETSRRSLTLFALLGDALDRYLQALRGLEAPSEVSAEHREFIDALEGSRAGISPILTALPGTATFDEIDRAIAGSGFADAQHRVEAACARLEQAIDDHGVDVDLRCEGMG